MTVYERYLNSLDLVFCDVTKSLLAEARKKETQGDMESYTRKTYIEENSPRPYTKSMQIVTPPLCLPKTLSNYFPCKTHQYPLEKRYRMEMNKNMYALI